MATDRLASRPQISMQQSPLKKLAFPQHKPVLRQPGIRSCQAFRRQMSEPAEEQVHRSQNQPGAPFGPAGWRLPEVSQQPARLRLRRSGNTRYDLFQLLGPEAVEEKMRNNKIKLPPGR